MKLRRRIKVHRLSPLWKPKLLDPEGPCDHEKMRRQSQWRTYEIEMKATFNKNQRQHLADLQKLDQEVMQLHAQNQEAASHMKQLYLRGPASMGMLGTPLLWGPNGRRNRPPSYAMAIHQQLSTTGGWGCSARLQWRVVRVPRPLQSHQPLACPGNPFPAGPPSIPSNASAAETGKDAFGQLVHRHCILANGHPASRAFRRLHRHQGQHTRGRSRRNWRASIRPFAHGPPPGLPLNNGAEDPQRSWTTIWTMKGRLAI